MGKVRLVQELCPERHCRMALAYREGEGTRAACEAELTALRAAGIGRPGCGICGSREFHFEDGATPWDTIAEARPHLEAAEQRQRRTRALMDALGLSAESERQDRALWEALGLSDENSPRGPGA